MRIILGAMLVVLSSCSFINNARNGNVGGVVGDVADGARTGKDIADKQKKCDALSKQTVTVDEEYQIGGAIALNLASNTSGVYVEISPDLQSAKPTPGTKPKPGSGEKTDVTRYVNVLGKSLAAFSSRPEIEWTFVVLDSSTPNAFSAPGGYVFVTTGMLKLVENEAQLAGILGHEIGHVTGRHSLETYKSNKATSCSVAIGAGYAVNAAANASQLARDFESIASVANLDLRNVSADVIASFTDKTVDAMKTGLGKEFEFAADKTALDLMIFGGYDPREYEKVLSKIPDGGLLTKHPSSKERLANLDAVKKADYAEFSFDALKSPDNSAVLKAVKK